jgi:hypothetical protein
MGRLGGVAVGSHEGGFGVLARDPPEYGVRSSRLEVCGRMENGDE